MGSYSGKMGAYGKPKFKKEFQKIFEKKFFLEIDI
jgi:hypothetical protein